MELLSGNVVVAHGAHDAGAKIGVGYPGTPSTETLESYATFDDVYAEWCTNEKVALEVAIGASAAGAKTLVTMKHVGVNVAADPLFTAAYTGVNGGMCILCADDPAMHSSQNEQDSHYYANAAHIPMLDPSDSQEAYDMACCAYEISEHFDVPVMLRSCVRISHTRGLVNLDPKAATDRFASDLNDESINYENSCDNQEFEYETDPSKWVMMPAFARGRREVQVERIDKLCKWAYSSPLNKIIKNGSDIGVICSGSVYQYVKEALPDASILKLGITYPLSKELISEFAGSVKNLYVIEEASTYLHEAVAACSVQLTEPKIALPKCGELDPETIKRSFGFSNCESLNIDEPVPARPPALCPGCPHRLVFKELTRQKAIITGDIGCYTLGALPPLSAMDTCVDMGASISMAHGFELALGNDSKRPVVAVIGDSTFGHSGLSSLLSTSYNKGAGCVCILDNRTTAMTGRQGNPFNGQTLQNRESFEVDLETLVRAIGIDDVVTVDPNDMEAVRSSIKSAVSARDRLSVIVFKRPCVLLSREKQEPYFIVSCTGCGVCLTLGCPAIGREVETGLSYIDANQCIGCGQCAQYCKFNAITR